MYKVLTFLSILVLLLIDKALAFIVTVDAHNEECFFDKVEGGSKFGVTFEVIEGGFLDVDIKITGPDQHSMHESENESSGKYAFVAPSTGLYKVCFNNEKSSMTPKVVMFSIDVGESPHRPPGAPGEQEVGHTKLEDMIRELSGLLTGVKHEQEYMQICDYKMRIRFVDACRPGSCHDAFIWKLSDARKFCLNKYENGDRNSWLLANSGYGLEPFILTPYRDPDPETIQHRFNIKHTYTRNIVERTIGNWKSRFRCLQSCLHYSPEKVVKILNVTCALHNICKYFNANIHYSCFDI